MIFNYVKFKNFLSYGDKLTTLPLSDKGIWLVLGDNKKDLGSNAAGKSSAVVETVVYALFGQTTKNLKAEEVVNNKNKKDCFVELSFNIGKNAYIIRRYRNHSQFNNSLFFEKNGKEFESEKKRDTQNLIESEIKMNFKSFVLSIVLSQEKVSGFAEKDSIDKRRTIESLLMFDFISKYHKVCKQIIRKINPKIDNLTTTYNDKKETAETLTDSLLDYVENWETELNNKKDQIKQLDKNIKNWNKINIKEEIENRKLLKRRYDQKSILEEKFINKKDKNLKVAIEVADIEEKIIDKQNEIDKINKNPEKCPVCKNKIKDIYFEKYLTERKSELEEFETSLNSLYEKDKLDKTELKRVKNLRDKKITQISTIKDGLSDDLSLEDVEHIQEKITRAESEINLLKSQIDISIEDDEHVKNTQLKIKNIKSEVRRVAKKIKKLKHERGHYEWWKEALSNTPNSIKSFCINHILTSLNKYINYYLEFFNYNMKYELNVNLEEDIMKDGIFYTYSQLSAGEKWSVEISLVFALYEIVKLKLPGDVNMIVLDELLSKHLDDVRINGVIEILLELKERGMTIFVIDHKNFLKENLDCNIITAIKNKEGFSSLELPS